MRKLFAVLLVPILFLNAQTSDPTINDLISKGEFTKATKLIDAKIEVGNLPDTEILEYKFEKERLSRIRKDFRKTEEDILKYVQKYFPDADSKLLEKWENDGSLEYKIIDGKKFYFNRAHTNLFRVNAEAKQQKNKIDGLSKDGLDLFLEKYIPYIISESKKSGSPFVMPVTMKLKYKLVVDTDVVPPGEVIRCWMPYPKSSNKRQSNIKLISVNSDNYIIAPEETPHQSIYFEKISEKGKPTEFNYELEYTALNEWHRLETGKIKPYDKNSEFYKNFTSERLPHIAFTETVENLSKKIIGDETDPLLIAKKIYQWINDNIPWAGAREYSTIPNISGYCLNNGYGDCGIQTLTMITLCRYNGIPARWQSGWMLHPGEVNLHDWGQIYFEGYGWVPVDQSFKLVDSEDEDVRWFFVGGIDAFHMIVNEDYSQNFFPAKIYPRSETVDFQRGEVEWRGGNLYFDQWDYFMNVEYIDLEIDD